MTLAGALVVSTGALVVPTGALVASRTALLSLGFSCDTFILFILLAALLSFSSGKPVGTFPIPGGLS